MVLIHSIRAGSHGLLWQAVTLTFSLALFVLVQKPERAHAYRETTSAALDRFEEVLLVLQEDRPGFANELLPLLIVEARSKYEESQGWFEGRVTQVLGRVLGATNLRACLACRQPRVHSEYGRLEHRSGTVGVTELRDLDATLRGTASPANAGLWIFEHARGLSVRIVDITNGQVLFAENIDATRSERTQTAMRIESIRELERRNRGEGITHAFVDIGLYPDQHISGDWVEQWGESNRHLSGLSVSLFDPVLGIGAAHYWVLPFANSLAGAKLLMSFPTATAEFATSVAEDDSEPPELIDPLLNLVAVFRMPIARSNYSITVTASTNGRVTVGLSTLNTSLLPVLP